MDTLLAVVALAALIALVAGLIQPRWVRTAGRGRVLAVYGGAAVLSLILLGIVADPVSAPAAPERAPTAAAPAAATSAPVAEAPTPAPEGAAPSPAPAPVKIPQYATAAYCEGVSQAVGGSYQIRATCTEQEQAAAATLRARPVEARIRDYCTQVGDAAGGSYQIYLTCVEQEQRAKAAG